MKIFKQAIREKRVHYITLLLICLLGFILRMINLDKSTGMWLDESNTYNIAKQSFPFGIMHMLKYYEPHTPLYYFILHFWMRLFGDNDYTLRLLSVIFGTLTIPLGYLAGKQLKDNFTGIVTSMLICCNSQLIYFSQEVRMYSLISCLIIFLVYFLIKIKENPTKLDYICLTITNTFLLYSFFSSFVIIILQAIIMSTYLYLYKRTNLKNYILSIIGSILLFLPYIPILVYQINLSLKYTIIWCCFKPLDLLYIVQEWFSPFFVLLKHFSLDHYQAIYTKPYFIFFGITSLIIYLIGILSAIIRRGFVLIPFFIGLSFLILEIISAINNKVVLESRYTVVVLPIFILVAAYGLSSLKGKHLKTSLIIFLYLTNLFYITFSYTSAPRLQRAYGYKTIATFLHDSNFSKGDIVLSPMATAGYRFSSSNSNKIFLEKYLNQDPQLKQIEIIPLNNSYIITQNIDPNGKYKKSIFTNYQILKKYIYSPEISEFNLKYFETEIHSKLGKGHYICLALETVDDYIYIKMNSINEHSPADAAQLFILSHGRINEDLLRLCSKYFKLIKTDHINSWDIFVYKND